MNERGFADLISYLPHDVEVLDVPARTDAERFYNGVICLAFPKAPGEETDVEAQRLITIFNIAQNSVTGQTEEATYYSLCGLANYTFTTSLRVRQNGTETKIDRWIQIDGVSDRALELVSL